MATPAQTSANSTGWSLKKLPTISVRTPSQSPRRVASARRIFYHMALLERRFGLRLPLRRRPTEGELERGQRPHELGMGGANVQICVLEKLLLVLPPENVATTAANRSRDIDSHLNNRTAKAWPALPLWSAVALCGVRVRELQVRSHLLEVPYQLLAGRSADHGKECPQGLDRKARLVEIAVRLGEPAVS